MIKDIDNHIAKNPAVKSFYPEVRAMLSSAQAEITELKKKLNVYRTLEMSTDKLKQQLTETKDKLSRRNKQVADLSHKLKHTYQQGLDDMRIECSSKLYNQKRQIKDLSYFLKEAQEKLNKR